MVAESLSRLECAEGDGRVGLARFVGDGCIAHIVICELDEETTPVSQTVPEFFSVAGTADDGAGDSIRLFATDTCPDT